MGYVYVFDFGDMVKVGYTTDLKTRQISIQSNLKKKAINIFSIPAPIEVESIAHKELEPFRVHGEYYNCTFDDACASVENSAKKIRKMPPPPRPGNVKFTMVMPFEMAQKLDYIRTRYGRSRIKEIEWACKQYILNFEEKVDKIELEDT